MVSTVITASELDRLRVAYPMVDLDPLTAQEEQLLLHRVRGLSSAAAARAAGMSRQQGEMLLETEKFRIILEFLIQQARPALTIDRDMLNGMLMQAHKKAATATEEISAVRELGKLNDLYPTEKKQLNINTKNITNSNQLENLSDAELIELSGETIDLDPQDITEVSNDS